MFNQWFKKEMALRGLTGFGGGATGLAANASGDAWEEAGITATGGTIHNNQENPDGTKSMKFDYDIIFNPHETDLDNKEFIDYIGDMLIKFLDEKLKRGDPIE